MMKVSSFTKVESKKIMKKSTKLTNLKAFTHLAGDDSFRRKKVQRDLSIQA